MVPHEKKCFIDLTMTERIADYAYFKISGHLDLMCLYDYDGDVVCAVAINSY